MTRIKYNFIGLLCFAALIFFASAALFYLTPLKNLNIIEPQIKDIAPGDFYKMYEKDPEKFIFIDVRPAAVYAEKHAAGSINIPIQNFYDERKNLPKSGKKIVLICSGGRASGVTYMYL